MGALAQQGDLKRIDLLVELLEAPDQDARLLAARELGETGYTPAIPALARLTSANDPLLEEGSDSPVGGGSSGGAAVESPTSMPAPEGSIAMERR